MNISHTEHIIIGQNSSGEVYLDIDDYELMDYIDDYLYQECGIEYDCYQEREDGYHMIIGDSYSFGHIKNLILKIPIQEIEEIYKLGHPEVEHWEPEKRSITFRDVMEGAAGIGLTVLIMIGVGTLSYFLVSWIKFDITPVAAVFAAILFGFSIVGERPGDTVVGLLIFGVTAYLFFAFFPYLKNFEISSSKFFLGATTGIIFGWCIAKLFKLIVVIFERGKKGST